MSDALELARDWVSNAVVGLNLCPFATKPFTEGSIRFASSDATAIESAMRDALTEIDHLIETPETQTTLLVFEEALEFEVFLDWAGVLEALVDDSGAAEFFLVATFHPNYIFEGEGDPKFALTNRSPTPMFHFIRHADFEEIDASVSEQIVTQNRETIAALSEKEIADIWPHA